MTPWPLRLARHLRSHLSSLWGITALTLAGAAIDTLKPWPMKLIVDSALSGKPLPEAARWFGALPTAQTPAGLLLWLALATIFLFLLGWARNISESYLRTGAGARMSYSLGAAIFDRLQRLSLRFHGRQPTGDLIKRITTDARCIRELALDVVLPLGSSLITLVAMFVIMWKLDRTLALVAVSVAPFLCFVIWRFSGPMEERSYEQAELQGKVMATVEQTLTALPIVRAFAREPHEDERFAARWRSADEAFLRALAAQLHFKIGADLVTALGTAAVMGFGGLHVMQGTLTVGGLLLFMSYMTSLYAPLQTLAYLSHSYASAAAGARRVFEILDAEDTIEDALGARPIQPRPGAGHVHFKNVSAGYDKGVTILKNIDMEARAGECVALVGRTGAGKSTLVSLIPRFMDPWKGCVSLDGVDLREFNLQSLRSNVSIVLQEPFLMPLTVAENISYGCPNATRDQIVAAAKAANADTFIQRLQQGYDTVLAERGTTLSGGERQRIAIARALLKNAPILILDEPTASLDSHTDLLIMEAVSRLIQGRTTFIIAHRLSTVRRADCIWVLDEGAIVESGTHEELIEKDGLYAGFYVAQFRPDSAEFEVAH